MKILFYFNGSSENHGCEAISRSMTKILKNNENTIYSTTPSLEAESRFSTDKIVNYYEFRFGGKNNIFEIAINKIASIVFGRRFIKPHYNKEFKNIFKDKDLCIALGGDNYCYGEPSWMMYRNNQLKNANKTIGLVGCSIEKEIINRKSVIADLKKYDFIIARESMTYAALLEAGISKNTHLIPDPAFVLDKKKVDLPKEFSKNTVGINVSPLVQNLQNSKEDIVIQNYVGLINYILDKTDMNVALIPHVIIKNNDDRTVLELLFSKFKENDRVFFVNRDGNLNAEEIKYVISKCRFFVGARTHATIAAYSQSVPTLVLGYSIKAFGIAKDIFGQHDNYVISVQNLKKSDELSNAFKYIKDNEESILKHYKNFMPEYIKKIQDIKKIVQENYENNFKRQG